MKYCSECGYKLPSGTEKFCPECGQNLAPSGEERPINIGNTTGDVFGAGLTGSENIVGKEVGYTVQGNVIKFHISGNVSKEVLHRLQRMMAVPTDIAQTSTPKQDVKTKMEESETAQQQIKNVLEEVNKIEQELDSKAGTEIQQIKAGDLQISKNELLLKEIILKGNEHHYKEEYNEAIECYDRAIEIDPNYALARNNKTILLDLLSKQKEKKAS